MVTLARMTSYYGNEVVEAARALARHPADYWARCALIRPSFFDYALLVTSSNLGDDYRLFRGQPVRHHNLAPPEVLSNKRSMS